MFRLFSRLILSAALSVGIAAADAILVTGSDLNDSRSSTNAGEIVGNGDFSGSEDGFTISWVITFDAGDNEWDYSYTFSVEPSHWTFEVSTIITPENVDTMILDEDFTVVGPQTFTGDPLSPNNTSPGGNGGNPNLPGDIYGIKADTEQTTYTFSSPQAPIWGDFYAKKGNAQCCEVPNTAWNFNFGTDPTAGTSDFSGWIPTPDTTNGGGTTEIPEPATLLLLGTGLLGIAARRRRHSKA